MLAVLHDKPPLAVRAGATSHRAAAARAYSSPRLSPDQTSVMVSITDVVTGSPISGCWRRPVEHFGARHVRPIEQLVYSWSHDGSRVFFGSSRNGSTTVFQKAGVAPEELFVDNVLGGNAAAGPQPTCHGTDDSCCVCNPPVVATISQCDSALPRSANSDIVLRGPSTRWAGRFSPNGRWVAYPPLMNRVKFECTCGRFQQKTDNRPRFAIAGGIQPEWRVDGKELFRFSADGKLTAVPVVTDEAAFRAGEPRALFDVEVPERIASGTRLTTR